MSIITISRGTKSGGLELADCLSKRLGYTQLSRETVIAESAKKYNIMEKFLLDKLEKAPNLWQKFTNKHRRYIIFIQCALLNFIKEDNIIYHGYAGQMLLKGLPHVLKLRVEAPMEYRIRSVKAEFNYNEDQAITYIEKVDQQRKRWVKMLYNEDWYNPSLYDLCVNLQNMTMATICEMVTMAVNQKDFRTSEQSIKLLNNMSLECEVKAALRSDDKIWGSHEVTVSAHGGVITLRGSVKTKELRDLITDTASKVKGVKECKSEISLLSDSIS
jgi:cytidylate kinase